MTEPVMVAGPSGVSIRTRLHLTPAEELALRQVGNFLGTLASRDPARRCADGLDHDNARWAARKRDLTAASSARWAGYLTRASNAQWALARRNQAAHITSMANAIAAIQKRLALQVGTRGGRRSTDGYRSPKEWHAKSRRLAALESEHAAAKADYDAGVVRVVRGGKRLAKSRHHLASAGVDEQQWRDRWDSARMFLSATGETGKPFGNATIRVDSEGRLSIRVPSSLCDLVNAPHRRFIVAAPVAVAHRGREWAEHVGHHRTIAYTISHGAERDRWYLLASWQTVPTPPISVAEALAEGCIGVDTNRNHLAAWQLDAHGNPVGAPRRFLFATDGNQGHRDAQVRHALSRLLHWAKQTGTKAVALEDLKFAESRAAEDRSGPRHLRKLINDMPTAKVRDRLAAMAARAEIAVVAVDPAYTSRRGREHWQQVMPPRHQTTGHDAAAIVIGRRAQGFSARRRTPPPPRDQSDRVGHRSVQAGPGGLGREETRPARPGASTRSASPPGQ